MCIYICCCLIKIIHRSKQWRRHASALSLCSCSSVCHWHTLHTHPVHPSCRSDTGCNCDDWRWLTADSELLLWWHVHTNLFCSINANSHIDIHTWACRYAWYEYLRWDMNAVVGCLFWLLLSCCRPTCVHATKKKNVVERDDNLFQKCLATRPVNQRQAQAPPHTNTQPQAPAQTTTPSTAATAIVTKNEERRTKNKTLNNENNNKYLAMCETKTTANTFATTETPRPLR